MAVSGELAADMARVRETASKLGESVEVALAALDRLLRDGSTGDGSGQERIAAILAGKAEMKLALIQVVRRLEAVAVEDALAFGRLKTRSVRRGGAGLFHRENEAPERPDPAGFVSLAGDIRAWLAQAETVFGTLATLGSTLKRCHASAELALDRVMERRSQALTALAVAQKATEAMRPALTENILKTASASDEVSRLALAARREELDEAFEKVRSHEEALLSEFQSLDELTSLLDVLADAVNNELATHNTVLAKLSAEVERCLLLHGAVASFARTAGAGPEECLELPGSACESRLARLIELARNGLLSNTESLRHKAAADEAFAQRLSLPEGGAHP